MFYSQSVTTKALRKIMLGGFVLGTTVFLNGMNVIPKTTYGNLTLAAGFGTGITYLAAGAGQFFFGGE